jgi:hypothetical protein
MRLAIEILGAGTAAPLVVAIGLVWLGRRWLSSPRSRRCLAAAALSAAFFAGYTVLALLPLPWVDFVPPPSWQSLPWLGLLAAILSPLATFDGSLRGLRWAVWLSLAIVAAWWLVPTWPDLWPSRPVSIALLAGYLFVLMVLLDALPDRLTGRLLPGVMTLSAGALAVLLAALLSIRFGQLACLAASALAGCFAASFLNPQATSRGLIPGYAVLLGGLAYVGCVEPVPPLPALLLIPAAPLTVWLLASARSKKQSS